jgi:D-arabinonate dehydratase
MSIELVEAWTVRLPLKNPVVFESVTFTERDYAIVRLTDSSGVIGSAYCLARGAPVAAAVRSIAPAVLGSDPAFSERLWSNLYASTITHGQRGVTMRAISLVDIAIWDIRARLANQPLYRILGGYRTDIAVSVGGGYYRERRALDEVAEELREYVNRGFRHVKIPAGGLDPAAEEAWVAAAREAVGHEVELALDTHWTWKNVEEARRVLSRLDEYRLSWAEDPLPPEAVVAAAELRTKVRTPLAIGDEQSGRWAYQNLLVHRAADIWRVDATCVGGITEFRKIAAVAATWGIPISTHVYPEIHVHLAASEEIVMGVEYVDPSADIDLSYRFVEPRIEPSAGQASPPSGDGHGLVLDWEQIERIATEQG